jgi:hypothetical protein
MPPRSSAARTRRPTAPSSRRWTRPPRFIAAKPEAAADIYLQVTGQGQIDRALLLSIIKSPEVQFKLAPQNTLGAGVSSCTAWAPSRPSPTSARRLLLR